jgi:hypothetical protein
MDHHPQWTLDSLNEGDCYAFLTIQTGLVVATAKNPLLDLTAFTSMAGCRLTHFRTHYGTIASLCRDSFA